ncbi:uncharacterized protein TrAFT101_009313 [Trichoderma asperellum]|uniref:uncharacterized protein n=1 Tax=Trichoderma asperellum TaxID=101201 RepID=UPI0033318F78|nr:hypothetical protein TrAFT101_009313 [Trichoderma asperellum]
MQGRQRRSRPMLFRLPAEILDKIIDLLEDDKEALASLALVDSDCWYLARTRQFTQIRFDYSLQSHELLRRMATEPSDDKNETKPLFPIGVCVRKVTASGVFFPHYSPGVVAADADYVNQRKLLVAGIASKMPNHDVLVCNDQVGLDNDFIEAISRCFAKHVKFKRIQIDKTWPMRPFLAPVR